jgi:hypothetical protein
MLTATSAPARSWFQDLFRWPSGATFGFSALSGRVAEIATTFGQTDGELLAAACRPVVERGPMPESLAQAVAAEVESIGWAALRAEIEATDQAELARDRAA